MNVKTWTAWTAVGIFAAVYVVACSPPAEPQSAPAPAAGEPEITRQEVVPGSDASSRSDTKATGPSTSSSEQVVAKVATLHVPGMT
ncbi:MAG: hypothetical protein IT207_03415 [Fimbriimonadaceae bacterium]|nr:hypothetical protein [Fimbriimonadaceae bacterium]